MKRLFLLTLLPYFWQASSAAFELPKVTHYKLDVQFGLSQRRVDIVATLLITNGSQEPHTKLPLLLYRLFTVGRVTGESGNPLRFKQDVIQFRDTPTLQAREVVVDLASPLQPNDSVVIVLSYAGFMFGYPEVMAYVKDRVDEHYSLLRPDAFAYPMLAEPTFASLSESYDGRFTYDVSATVPDGYRVACGGALINTRVGGDISTFTFRSKVPTWRIDLAVAKFAVLSSPEDQLDIYYLPEDSAGAWRVMGASREVIKFYSEIFGRPVRYRGFSIIEIPDGWGSQASDYYFLQTAAAFKDSTRIPEVYHEIGHTWNATPARDVRRCRYFDEAFASFFEALAVRRFQGEAAFEQDMEHSREIFIRWAEFDRQTFETPIAGYGAKELGRHSYTKGAWSLYVLYRLVGETTFGSIIRNMMSEFAGRTINFEQFQQVCEKAARRNLNRFFQEWIYGTESSQLLVDMVPVGDILKRY